MKLKFHTQALALLYLLQKAGYEAYIVGGAVRDIFLRAMAEQEDELFESYDYDLTTNAEPEKVMEILGEGAFYENDFGTVSIAPEKLKERLLEVIFDHESDEGSDGSKGIKIEEKEIEIIKTEEEKRIIDYLQATKIHESLQMPEKTAEVTSRVKLGNYEITTYRSGEVYEQDFRHPTKMEWGKSIVEDLERRDFTINAMAVKVNQAWLIGIFERKEKLTETGLLPEMFVLEEGQAELIDLFAGREDLTNRLIKCVGEPAVRFEEDALRMLRAVRFGAQLDFELEEQTWGAIRVKSDLLEFISQERIRDELLRMLSSDHPAEAIEVLDETGCLRFILPELLECKGIGQAGTHHQDDVWTHSINSLRYCPSRDPIVRLATLIHDIGKAPTAHWDANGRRMTFFNHQLVGAKMAGRIARRLRLSKIDCERIYNLVRHHMFHYQPENTDAAVRRLMREVGLENLDDLLAVRVGDRIGSGSRETSWRMEELKRRMIEQLHQPMDVRDLAIDGNDLMKELDLKPSRALGEILSYLLDLVLENSELNEREILLDKAKIYLLEKESGNGE